MLKLSELKEGDNFRFPNYPENCKCIKRSGKLEYSTTYFSENNKPIYEIFTNFYDDKFDRDVEFS